MYYIYCYTNKINGHKYVGQTNNIERRKREHRSVMKNRQSQQYNSLFYSKLREYGEDNFTFSVLEEINTNDRNIVHQQEIFWIQKMNSFVGNNKGYNLTLGGDGVNNSDRLLSDEDILELIKSIKNGESYIDISHQFGISISYISMINTGLFFKQPNTTYPLYKYYRTNNDYLGLIELLQYSDLTLQQIAIELNLSLSTVKKINYGTLREGLVSDYPIRKKTPQQKRADRVKELLILKADNNTIVRETGVSITTIQRINIGKTNKDTNLLYPLR